MKLRRRRDDALIVLLLSALATLLAVHDGGWRLDRLLYDSTLAMLPRPAAEDIVIVAIDDVSIAAVGRWPWPRTVHATLLERIAAARPRAIALDFVLSEPAADPAQDRWLAQALQHAAPVVVPVPWTATTGALLPVPALRPHLRLASAEPAVDADGVLRHLFLYAGPPAAPLPHLALAVLEAGGGRLHPALAPVWDRAPGAEGGWQRDGRLLLRYQGPPGTMRRISALELLQGRIGAAELGGRDVLIGVTAQGLGDTLATPVNGRHHAMAGIEVLAQSLQMLRSGDGLRSPSPLLLAMLSSFALTLLVLAYRPLGARRALALTLASVPLLVLAAAASLAAGWTWSPLPYALPALLAYPLWSWRRLEQTVKVLAREIGHLAAEPLAQDQPAQRSGNEGDPLAAQLRDLRSAAQVVRDARLLLAGALEALPTAMLVGDGAGRVALANARAAGLFEVESAADLRGLDLARLLAEFAPRQPLDWFAALLALQPGGPGLSVEATLAGADCLVHVAAVELLGERRLIVSAADLAPVHQAQRQREETLAFITHDLRAPANAMLLLTDPQRADAWTGDSLRRELRRLAERTLSLSEDFVQAARAQTRPLHCEPVAAQTLLAEGVADLRAAAEAAGVGLLTAADPGPALRLDRALVVRAIANLVSNAIKHSPPGSQVRVQARHTDAALLAVEVSDAGPGLAADQAAALAAGEDALRVAGPGGVGLGLLFVQRVARRHGGALAVAEDRPGTLRLTLIGQG